MALKTKFMFGLQVSGGVRVGKTALGLEPDGVDGPVNGPPGDYSHEQKGAKANAPLPK